jgi:nucleotide-binding universal stress UspA family protein
VDFLETSQRAVEYALSLAEEANGRLTLLHTIEWVPDEGRPTHATFGLNLYRQAVLTEARARLAELVPAEARDWCQIDMRVACGEPSAEILRAAAAERADLVVLGAGHPGPIDRMLFGSTTPQVLRQASCPVLTVGSSCAVARHEGLAQTAHSADHAEHRP